MAFVSIAFFQGKSVSLEVSININSLELVYSELVDNIDRAMSEFESYTLDQAMTANLSAATEIMAQISGVLNFIELPGAENLAAQISSVLVGIQEGNTQASMPVLEVISNSLVVLPRYLSYCRSKKLGLPILLVENINALRQVRKLPLLAERMFCKTVLPLPFKVDLEELGQGGADGQEDIRDAVRRVRHMYQTGLLGIIRDDQSSYPLELMQRSVNRMCQCAAGSKQSNFWRVVNAVMSALSHQGLSINSYRKRIFAGVEKQLRPIAMQGVTAFDAEPPKELLADLQFMLMLSSHNDKESQDVFEALSLEILPLKDQQLSAAKQSMQGPCEDTFGAVSKVVKEEISAAKEVLEIAAQEEAVVDVKELKSLQEILKTLADTLVMLEIKPAIAMVNRNREQLEEWLSKEEFPEPERLIEVADTLLFVEGVVSELPNTSSTTSLDFSEAQIQEIIAKSQLSKAINIVIKECKNSVSMVTRAISSFLESNNDKGHMANVSVTLMVVRGALDVLQKDQAASIIHECTRLVDNDSSLGMSADGKDSPLVNSLADALISVEYYLSELEANRIPDENILKIAEESIHAFSPEPV